MIQEYFNQMVDYQQIIDITAVAFATALPIAILTGFLGKVFNMVLDFALGKERVKL